MKPELLLAEFLEELQNRANEHFKGLIEQAFVAWYVDAEFGSNVKWDFTDGAHDGGIDAVVWCENDAPGVVILQSKFSKNVGKKQLGSGPYDEFESVVRGFRYGGDDLELLLNGAADELRKPYRKAYDKLNESNTWHTQKKAFRLITTNTRRADKEFESIPAEGFMYSDYILDLYKKYRIVQTPTARPLQLYVQDKLAYHDPTRNTTSYLFNARVSDFRTYLEKNDVARLVARNIRYNLGGGVGRAIRETYEKKPKDFWYLHNGLTIICDEYVEKSQTATLTAPSVVNGAQSLYAIAGSTLKDSPALVTVRVIVRGSDTKQHVDDDQWVQKVIKGVNTQNRVKSYDFRSNDPEQAELQRQFKEQRVFYERKRGEWKEVRTDPKYKGHARLAMQRLGQVMTVVKDDEGQGVLLVKRSTEAIFEDKIYKELFPSRSKVAYRFKRTYFAYRLYRLLSQSDLGCKTDRQYRLRRHSFWNVLWVLHRVLTPSFAKANLSTEQVKELFDEFEESGLCGRRARAAVTGVAKAVWRAYRTVRKQDPERWTPNNFFKQKYGIKVLDKVAIPKAKKAAAFLVGQLSDLTS